MARPQLCAGISKLGMQGQLRNTWRHAPGRASIKQAGKMPGHPSQCRSAIALRPRSAPGMASRLMACEKCTPGCSSVAQRVCAGVLCLPQHSNSHRGKLNRNQKPSSYCKVKPEQRHEVFGFCGRTSIAEVPFPSPVPALPLPRSSLCKPHALRCILQFSLEPREKYNLSFHFADEDVRPETSMVHRQRRAKVRA